MSEVPTGTGGVGSEGVDPYGAVADAAAGSARPQLPMVIRPRRIVIFGAIAAAVVLGTVIVLGLMLQADGIPLRIVDKVGFMSVGLFGAAAIMLVARPKITADESGLTVRNVLGDSVLPWPIVHRIAFPPGAHWAQAMLADDETQPLMAIQAMDRDRAVAALKAIRALHAQYAPKAPEPTQEALDRARRRAVAEAAAAASRPLGRLEQIDRAMAAKGPKAQRRRR